MFVLTQTEVHQQRLADVLPQPSVYPAGRTPCFLLMCVRAHHTNYRAHKPLLCPHRLINGALMVSGGPLRNQDPIQRGER